METTKVLFLLSKSDKPIYDSFLPVYNEYRKQFQKNNIAVNALTIDTEDFIELNFFINLERQSPDILILIGEKTVLALDPNREIYKDNIISKLDKLIIIPIFSVLKFRQTMERCFKLSVKYNELVNSNMIGLDV